MPPKSTSAANEGTAAAVKVLAKVRPFSPGELAKASGVPSSPMVVQANSIKVGEKNFSFEMCFSGIQGAEQRPHQRDIYAHIGPSMVECALQGYNATMFAYGQTGSGKTHTMMGPSRALEAASPTTIDVEGDGAGIIPRFADDVFAAMAAAQDREEQSAAPTLTSFRVTARYFEVYCEKAYDLLNAGAEIRVRDNGRLDGITEDVVTNPSSVMALIRKGNAHRSTGATLKNARSSRSHAVFQLVFHQSVVPLTSSSGGVAPSSSSSGGGGGGSNSLRIGGEETTKMLRKSLRASLAACPSPLLANKRRGAFADPEDEDDVGDAAARAVATPSSLAPSPPPAPPTTTTSTARTIVSTISLVDLAGSERQKQSGAEGQQFKEMVNINQSLTTLRRVVQVLSDNSHLRPGQQPMRPPVRESVLTHALSSSFGGNSKAFIVVNMSPHADDLQDTLSTLEFSNIARKVVNHVKVNVDENTAMLRGMAEEIERLKAMLAEQSALARQAAMAAAAAVTPRTAEIVTVVQSAPSALTRDAATMTADGTAASDAVSAELEEKLRTTQALFDEMQEQAEAQAHTNIYLVEQIRQKEDAVVALQRQVADMKRFFTASIETYFKERKDVQQLIAALKAPLQRMAGCPQCQSVQTELFVVQGKNIALKEELAMLTASQERTYIDMERLRQKHEVTVTQLADMRNQLNVVEDRQMIIDEQRSRIEELERQIAHHLEARVQLTMENHALRTELESLSADGGGGGDSRSGGCVSAPHLASSRDSDAEHAA